MKGKIWKFGDNVNTDDIIPAVYLISTDETELARHCFESFRPEFREGMRKGDIIAAGENFGCGSSREHAPRSIKGLGASCVIAKSFARIFYRNAINIGLPVIECREFVENAEEGSTAEVNLGGGIIVDVNSGMEYKFLPYPGFLREIISSGGLMKHAGRGKGGIL